MRFSMLTLEEYKLMKKAGFRFVLFGLESANQATLDRINKGEKIETKSANVFPKYKNIDESNLGLLLP